MHLKKRGEKSCIDYKFLKERRLQKNFTQMELAKETGLDHKHLGQIERGQGVRFLVPGSSVSAPQKDYDSIVYF